MRKQLGYLKSKLGFLVAVILAAGVGGLTTSLVRASVPDTNGRISACYRTNGGDLRVIDTANPTDVCSNKETGISWNQGRLEAFGQSVWHPDNQTNTLDNSRSFNVVNLTNLPDTAGMCIQTSFTPKNVLADFGNAEPAAIKDENGWSNTSGEVCDTVTGSNVFIPVVNRNQFFLVH